MFYERPKMFDLRALDKLSRISGLKSLKIHSIRLLRDFDSPC